MTGILREQELQRSGRKRQWEEGRYLRLQYCGVGCSMGVGDPPHIVIPGERDMIQASLTHSLYPHGPACNAKNKTHFATYPSLFLVHFLHLQSGCDLIGFFLLLWKCKELLSVEI
jgi:hypothetical protein